MRSHSALTVKSGAWPIVGPQDVGVATADVAIDAKNFALSRSPVGVWRSLLID